MSCLQRVKVVPLTKVEEKENTLSMCCSFSQQIFTERLTVCQALL